MAEANRTVAATGRKMFPSIIPNLDRDTGMAVVVEDLHEEHGSVVGLYQHGGCIAFARAAHERTGWQAVAVNTMDGRFAHVGLRTPDGTIFDSRGHLSESEFAGTWQDLHDADLDELESRHPYSEFVGEMAARHLTMLFPDFPGELPIADRLDAFARGLQELCQAHGFHLRSGLPHGMVLYPSYGDESGYDIHVHAGSMTVERRLGPELEKDGKPAP